ncbi:MAG: hypothetical protein HUK40_02745 [Desulfobacter sp.]|nr:hypothetical protein [Desulfobacter sp.]WDP85284.1 MAG: hypothetical protein HUN05_09165 [Desulfobacter sp.]
MTYNFDPDKWYDDELYILQSKLKNRQINDSEYDQAIESLDKKFDEMLGRLDGTYQIDQG